MKILLVGEFSRLHNSLKEGLVALGHEVTLVATGDDFKNYPVDFSFAAKTISSNALFKLVHKGILKVFKFDLKGIEKGLRFYKFLPQLKDYDVVQLINSDALETNTIWAMYFYKKLFEQNKKIHLLICGDETPIVEVLLKNNLKYSVLTPYLENPKLKAYYNYPLKFVTDDHRRLYDYIAENCDGISVSDLDYKIPMEQTDVDVTFIPNPINIAKIGVVDNPIGDKIVIFHGVNKLSSIKKGSHFFAEALKIIEQKYPDKVKVITVNSLPYAEYEKVLNEAHIVLDQVYSFDQGYNALEAMAKGKVVFTGAETEFENYYKLTQKVAINALPDVDYLVSELSFLIENPSEIIAIGQRARAFIEKEHDYISIAEKYLAVWENSISKIKYWNAFF